MGPVIAPLRPRRSSLSAVAKQSAMRLDFWPCYLCCLRDPGSVHHRPARAMLASLLFEPCSSSPGHLRPCAPCCVGHAESQPYARSDTAPVVCALRVFVVAGVPAPQGASFERRRRGQGRDTVAAAVGVGPPRPRAPARPAPSLVSPTHPPSYSYRVGCANSLRRDPRTKPR